MQLHQTQVGNPVNQQSSDKKLSNKADQQSSDKVNQQLYDDDSQESSEEGDLKTDNDEEDNVVPVVTRPGHIRFAPLGKGIYGSKFTENNLPMPFDFAIMGTSSRSRTFC